MSCNIANEYISFSQKSIKKYLEVILGKYFDQDIYDDMIDAYLNVRYYNLYPSVDKHFEVNIIYYLKKCVDKNKNDEKYEEKAKYMFDVFKYILYFDSVRECESVRPLITNLNSYRIDVLGIDENDFESKIYTILKNNLVAKKEFIDSFEDKNFTVNYVKVKNDIFDCVLDHNIKFSKLYSNYAIEKVFNSKEIRQQKLFVTYSMVCAKAILDVVKGNFDKKYLIDYSLALGAKPRKRQRLLNIIDNDIIKEKIVLKVDFASFLSDKNAVYDLTRDGYKVGIIINEDFVLSDENKELLKAFTYMITSDEKVFNDLSEYDILYIPS